MRRTGTCSRIGLALATIHLLPLSQLSANIVHGSGRVEEHELAGQHGTPQLDLSPTIITGSNTEGRLPLTAKQFKGMGDVIVAQEEGIIYCPISKVASAEWKLALRWIVGVDDWDAPRFLHRVGQNGLTELSEWGIQGTRRALRSDRFFRFVVVRDPAERLLSAFLKKCLIGGNTMRHYIVSPTWCPFLDFLPDFFPNTTDYDRNHEKFIDLVENSPEDTMYHFVTGMRHWIETHDGDACLANTHFKPQVCFCDLPEILPAFYVIKFSNMTAEAAEIAGKLPAAALNPPQNDKGVDTAVNGAMLSEIEMGVGVNETRREEIRTFLTAHAFRGLGWMSRRDYEYLGQYFPEEEEEEP